MRSLMKIIQRVQGIWSGPRSGHECVRDGQTNAIPINPQSASRRGFKRYGADTKLKSKSHDLEV